MDEEEPSRPISEPIIRPDVELISPEIQSIEPANPWRVPLNCWFPPRPNAPTKVFDIEPT